MSTPSRPPPWLCAFRAAWTFLTRIPVGGFPYPDGTWRWITMWFPIVGLCLGLMYWVLWAALPGLGPLSRVLVVMIFGVLVTGGFHEDGLSDSFDALGGAYEREGVLRILKDSRVGAFGAIALILALGLKASLLVELGPAAPLGFVLGQSLSRALPVVQLGVQPYARRDDPSSKSRDVARSGKVQAVVALAFALVLGLGACWTGSLSFAQFGAMGLSLALIGLVFGRYVQVRAGGLTGDFLGALQQLGELAILAVLAWS